MSSAHVETDTKPANLKYFSHWLIAVLLASNHCKLLLISYNRYKLTNNKLYIKLTILFLLLEY